VTRLKQRITIFLFLLTLVTYLDRVNISIAGALLSQQYGFDRVQLGTIFSAFVLGYTVFQIPAGWIGDRFGHKKALIFAVIWWSVFTAATAWIANGFLMRLLGALGAFWIVRFLIGIGEAATFPCANGIIAESFGRNERASISGMMFAGVGVGTALTPPLIAWTMLRLGWQSAFYICGAIGLVLALGLHVNIPARLSEICAQDVSELGTPQSSGQPNSSPTTRRAVFGNMQVWLLTIGMIMFGYIVYVYYFWFYIYLVQIRKFSLLRSAFAAAVPFLTMAVCAPAGGWLSDRMIPRLGSVRARRLVAMTGLTAAACFIPAGAATRNPISAVAFLSLGAGSVYLAVSSYFTTALEILPGHAATVVGTINTGANLGGVFSPALTPWIASHYGWFPALSLTAVLSFIAAMLWKFTGSSCPEDAEASPVVR
jgi:ACS family glucarate transporter-like MFS transporter